MPDDGFGHTILDTLKATLIFKDPKEYLFFTRTAKGKATADTS